MDQGCIKLFRRILSSQVFAHQTALKIWIWCLCKATFKDRFVTMKSGKGEITIKLLAGQFIFGRFKAEDELGIDGSTIYKWIQKFATEEYNMITIVSNNQYSIITICNWDEYQISEKRKVTTKEQPKNSEVTAEEQPSNTNNNDNNDNNVKNEKHIPDFEDFKNYALENKPDINIPALELKYKSWVQNNWKTGKGQKIVNWKSTLLNTIPYIKNENNSGNNKRAIKHVNDHWN